MSASKEYAQDHCANCDTEVENLDLDIPTFCCAECLAEYYAKPEIIAVMSNRPLDGLNSELFF